MTFVQAVLHSAEILKSRNAHHRGCTPDWKYYDDMVLKKHIETKGCRVPYVGQHKGYPTCNTQLKIKQSIYNFDDARKNYLPKACQRISDIDCHWGSAYDLTSKEHMIGIFYPEDIKVLTHSKEVDFHALIGNIGGYIGLFLGNLLIINSYYCE